MTKTPVFFISHGAPTTLIDTKSAARLHWQDILRPIVRPRGFLVISAHWETETLEVTADEKPDLIYDFYNFPQDLYDVTYDVSGNKELSNRIAHLLNAELITGRGIDHGVWVPLKIMHPAADIPVIQLSLPVHWKPEALFKLGQRLEVLREEGVMILASGALTHNLKEIRTGETKPDIWAQDFEDWFVSAIEDDRKGEIVTARQTAPHYQKNHPKDEHFLPIHIALGAAGQDQGHIMHRGFEYRNISMTSVCFA